MPLSQDVVKDIFEIEHGKQLTNRQVKKEASNWAEKVEETASRHLNEKNYSIDSTQKAADLFIREFPYTPLKQFDPGKEKYPPCSVIKAVQGGPLNCVGRVASLVLIDEIKGLDTDPLSSIKLEFNVNYRQKPEGGREVKDGHITAFIRRGGDKEYLGTRYDYTANKEYPVTMLPATYAVQNAVAVGGIIGDEAKAKKMAQEAIQLGAENSTYLSHIAHRIINY